MAMTATERSRNRRERDRAKKAAAAAGAEVFQFETKAGENRPAAKARGKVAELVKIMRTNPPEEAPAVKTLTVPRVLDLKDFSIGATGMTVKGTPTYNEWAGVGELLRTFEKGIQFSVGDWLNYGEDAYGEKAAQAIDATEWSEESLRVYRWVSKSVPVSSRLASLSFKHHQIVAALPAPEQLEWLQKAAAGDDPQDEREHWTVARLNSEMKSGGAMTMATKFWVLVSCETAKDQDVVSEKMTAEGRAVKAITRREKVAK